MPGTISRSEHDRIVREALAGVFALTPLDLYVYLGGKVEEFDAEARAIMEWWLRSNGYAERKMSPACWTPRRRLWVRRKLWRKMRGGRTRTSVIDAGQQILQRMSLSIISA
jgi:hypothetical protein